MVKYYYRKMVKYYYRNNNGSIVEVAYLNLPSDYFANFEYILCENEGEAAKYFSLKDKIFEHLTSSEIDQIKYDVVLKKAIKSSLMVVSFA